MMPNFGQIDKFAHYLNILLKSDLYKYEQKLRSRFEKNQRGQLIIRKLREWLQNITTQKYQKNIYQK